MYQWTVNQAGAGNSPTTSVQLSLGESQIGLAVVDSLGAYAVATQIINVIDSTPPEIGTLFLNRPTCIAPPNHKYVVLSTDDLRAVMADQCDPRPFLRFLSAVSNQVDNATGDGDTTDDIVVFDDHVCLRAERSGTMAGRVYDVRVVAQDASGNQADPVITIVVPHDMRDHDCPSILPSDFADEGDPRCSTHPPSSETLLTATPTPETAAGCSQSGVGTLAWIGFLLATMRKRQCRGQ